MKTLFATITAIFIGLVALPEKAEARSYYVGHSYTYISGYASCGSPIYTKRVVVGYDCYRRPIYRYYKLPVVKRYHNHYKPRHYRSSHNRYYNHRYRSNHRSNYRYYSNRGSYRYGRTCR